MSRLTEIIGKDKFARFTHYCDGEFWFTCDGSDFAFPVPGVDMLDAVVYATEPTVYYMRWIRKHLEYLEKCRSEQASCD